MTIIIAAIILASAIVFYAISKEKYHLKPKTAFVQFTVLGNTEQSETVQMSATLLKDESEEEWNKKVQWMYEAREKRLKFQNERLLELQAEHEAKRKEAEAALKEAGIKLAPPVKS